ncbi:MAG TPA: peroxidase-related enzyme [Vicinamibacteria bacterium]|nr:peroxidase-related enzyme [Vicinamibacteria bacterium]
MSFWLLALALGSMPQEHKEEVGEIAWIRVISYDESTGELRRLYDLVKGASGNVDNVVKVHSLRPHTLEGHYALYKAVLHHPENRTPAWFLETLGVYTSLTNGCDYSVAHHFEGLRRVLGDDDRAETIRTALSEDRPERVFSGKELALLRYAKKLTLDPRSMTRGDIDELRAAGVDDGEILEANQIVAYFNYANRVLDGLGVTTVGDVLGTSPRTKR